jgi:hypothetical protein
MTGESESILQPPTPKLDPEESVIFVRALRSLLVLRWRNSIYCRYEINLDEMMAWRKLYEAVDIETAEISGIPVSRDLEVIDHKIERYKNPRIRPMYNLVEELSQESPI